MLVVLVGLLSPASAAARSDRPAAFAETILVKFDRPASAAAEVAEEGDRSLGRTRTGVQVVGLEPGESVEARVAAYEARGDVAYAERNPFATAALARSSDPDRPSQWGLDAIGAPAGWSVHPGSYAGRGGVVVAVLDTGIDETHPELDDGRVLGAAGASCLAPDAVCRAGSSGDPAGHGTTLAGVIAAEADNGVGVAGVAFSSSLMPVKVLGEDGRGSYAGITNGILWAATHGARVINLSLGGYDQSQTLCDAVARAVALGVVVVAAAGNEATTRPFYPAACPGAVGVAASDQDGSSAPFSNSGAPNVFVSAPGVSILSTWPGNGYAYSDGTSIAAPFVSALSALVLGQAPTRSPNDVRNLLARTAAKTGGAPFGADPLGVCADCGWSPSSGYGRIDVAGALGAVAAPASSAPAAPAAPPPPPLAAPASEGVQVNAGLGSDLLAGTPLVDVFRGGAGNDRMRLGAGNDVGEGGAGDDVLEGGPGEDRLTGGAGRDRISGGPGNDLVLARDGARDTIDCGLGRDVVVADRIDRIDRSCEVVQLPRRARGATRSSKPVATRRRG